MLVFHLVYAGKIMKNTFTKIYLQIFILIAVFSSGVFAQNKSSDLSSARWNLIEINGKKLSDSKAFIELNEMQVTGNAGCNRIFGKYEQKGKNIKFFGIGATKKFCAENGVMKTETELLNALNKASIFAAKGNTLSLYAKNRLVLKFRKAETENSAGNSLIELEDKKWMLEATENSSAANLSAFLVFDKTKQNAGGNTGCNAFGAAYSANSEKIKFTEIISTFRACLEDEKMKIEREFLNGLRASDNFVIKNEKLYLYKGKNLLLSFSAASK